MMKIFATSTGYYSLHDASYGRSGISNRNIQRTELRSLRTVDFGTYRARGTLLAVCNESAAIILFTFSTTSAGTFGSRSITSASSLFKFLPNYLAFVRNINLTLTGDFTDKLAMLRQNFPYSDRTTLSIHFVYSCKCHLVDTFANLIGKTFIQHCLLKVIHK